jgi:aminopeptidase N
MRTVLVILTLLIGNYLSAQFFTANQIWNEGIGYLQEGDFLRGVEYMNRYLRVNPSDIHAMKNCALGLKLLGDQEAACNKLNEIRLIGGFKNRFIHSRYCENKFWIRKFTRFYYPHQEIYPELGLRPLYTRADTLRGSLRPERTCFDVLFYDLTVRIIPENKSIEGSNIIWFRGVHESDEIQIDLFEQYAIQAITLDSENLTYTREYNAIFIHLPERIIPGKEYILTIEYSGKPGIAENPPWLGGFVWSHDKRLNRWVGVVCEYLGASSWWPNKDHLSDRPDSMEIHIEVPDRYNAVSNGQLRSVTKLADKYLSYDWFVSYPINNYNVTFYMGKYEEIFDTMYYNQDTLLARYHVMPYNRERAQQHFKQAREVVNFYNQAFGPFPFWKDNFRMVEAPFEGMEHQTAIAYGHDYNNSKNSLTYLNRNYDYIIVHETAHEWWGNSVTASDMADIWLHEGFATYAEILFLEHEEGYDQAVNELHNRMKYIYNIWPLVQNRGVNENAFVSDDVYTKGAVILHCLRATINDDSLFMAMLHDFNLAYRDSTIDSDAFVHYVNEYTGRNFVPFFNKFLYETELPTLYYTYKRKPEGILLRYKWKQVDEGFEMPFSIRMFPGGESYRLEARTDMQEILIPDAESFIFYNYAVSPEKCPKNGLTYFRTRNGNQ